MLVYKWQVLIKNGRLNFKLAEAGFQANIVKLMVMLHTVTPKI
jgi:hypothetical protein